LDEPREHQYDQKQWTRAHAQVTQLRSQIARRDRELSLHLVARDQLAQELALARWSVELADKTVRIMNQLAGIAAHTSPGSAPTLQRRGTGGVRSTLRRLRQTTRTGVSLFAIERLRRKLHHSPLFDVAWYVSQRPDLTPESDPLDHFLFFGMNEGTSPNPLIHVDWLVSSTGQAREVVLRTYLLHGCHGESRPTALFDSDYYRRIAGLEASADALSHYLRFGRAAGLSPHPLFDPDFYRSQLPKLATWKTDPFLHYVLFPFELDPHPLFSNEYYLRQHPELRTLGVSPLVHYLEYGFREKTSPHPSFSGPAYLDRYKEVAKAGLNPLLHYVMSGRRERFQIEAVNPRRGADAKR